MSLISVRRKMRWSVETLAERANVGVEDLVDVEQGAGTPEPRTLFKLAHEPTMWTYREHESERRSHH
jgi:transcriptional regulator with XRE-family HTH domain